MPDPLLGRPVFVAEPREDGDDLELVASAPGPAGSVEIQLGTVEVALDAADPGAINQVRIALVGGELDAGARRDLERLVGADLLDEIDRVVREPPLRTRQLGLHTQDPRSEVDRLFVRLATAATESTRPGLLAHERALSTLEAAGLARRLGLSELATDWSGDVIGAAATLAVSAASVVGLLAGSPAGPVAADLCDAAARWPEVAPVAAQLRAIASELRRPKDSPPERTRPRPPSLRTGPPISDVATISPDSLAPMVTGTWPTVTRDSQDEFEVRLPGWAERAVGWWVRSFSELDAVPIAAVPLESSGDDSVAYFIVPPRYAGRLTIDVVEDPGEPRSSERVAAFRAAIATGRRAARLERLDRHDEAAATWRESSEFHRRAGDDWRAATAQAIADQHYRTTRGGRGPTPRPVLADLVGPDV